MHFRDIGLSSANGIISLGIPIKFVIGNSKFAIKSIIPDDLSAPIATNSPISVGTSFTTISIPSLLPSRNVSKTFFFSIIPYDKITNIVNGIAKLEI